jgi:hypothetical protein
MQPITGDQVPGSDAARQIAPGQIGEAEDSRGGALAWLKTETKPEPQRRTALRRGTANAAAAE